MYLKNDSCAGKEIPEDGELQRVMLYAGADHVLHKVLAFDYFRIYVVMDFLFVLTYLHFLLNVSHKSLKTVSFYYGMNLKVRWID